MEKLRYRQVHLDFHTSEHIPGIGAKFDKRQWQDTLREAHVDSITCFSCCHHGWSYHPTQVGVMHPELKFDLLRAQMDACKEIDVNVPVYLTAGINTAAWSMHPEWSEVSPQGKVYDPLFPHFRKMCFNSPYLDYLCALIREAAELFPEADGIFLDIICQGQCCCKWCLEGMFKAGLDPQKEADRIEYSKRSLLKYYQRTTEASRHLDPKMRVFHNSGHITPGDTGILKYFSHLELESLPTGGWGYDHYPMSAAYARKLGFDFLGMTGKFHTTWGEFGGFKHPNALRYECAAMLAQGSKCSVGDQLHPDGKLNHSTYNIIGAAYREVEAKEPWCDDAKSAATLAVLSSAAETKRRGEAPGRHNSPDTGAVRLLLESQLPFDLLDFDMDFSAYETLVLPDNITLDAPLEAKLTAFLAKGGKLVLSGESGQRRDDGGFGLGLDVEDSGLSEYLHDFAAPAAEFAPSFVDTPFVMYAKSRRIKARSGRSLGDVYYPYFNRTIQHFCSHQHAPNREEASGFDCGAMWGNILYFAHPVFSLYHSGGAVALKDYVAKALRAFLGDGIQIKSNLPSQARATLMRQDAKDRHILHLLYANTILRGAADATPPGGIQARCTPLEVIEELHPLHDVEVDLAMPGKPKKVTLEPQGAELPFQWQAGRLKLKVDSFTCHQMIAIQN